jgi:hypothetical protein
MHKLILNYSFNKWLTDVTNQYGINNLSSKFLGTIER